MRVRARLAAGVMLGACLMGGAAQGAVAAPELICRPTETIPEFKRLTGWLVLDFIVKPQSRELCLRDHCLALTDAGEGRLQYRCSKATVGGYCLGSFAGSSGGPFVYEETLVIDPSKGAFESALKGSVGDMGPQRFDVRVVGVCQRVAAEAAATALALRAVLRLPYAAQGRAYGPVWLLAGGAGPYSLSVVKGALPPGLSLEARGFLSGTPSRAGDFQFVLRSASYGDPGHPLETAFLVHVTAAAAK